MTKFSGSKRRSLRINLMAPIRTGRARTLTHEGGAAHRDPRLRVEPGEPLLELVKLGARGREDALATRVDADRRATLQLVNAAIQRLG